MLLWMHADVLSSSGSAIHTAWILPVSSQNSNPLVSSSPWRIFAGKSAQSIPWPERWPGMPAMEERSPCQIRSRRTVIVARVEFVRRAHVPAIWQRLLRSLQHSSRMAFPPGSPVPCVRFGGNGSRDEISPFSTRSFPSRHLHASSSLHPFRLTFFFRNFCRQKTSPPCFPRLKSLGK